KTQQPISLGIVIHRWHQQRKRLPAPAIHRQPLDLIRSHNTPNRSRRQFVHPHRSWGSRRLHRHRGRHTPHPHSRLHRRHASHHAHAPTVAAEQHHNKQARTIFLATAPDFARPTQNDIDSPRKFVPLYTKPRETFTSRFSPSPDRPEWNMATTYLRCHTEDDKRLAADGRNYEK